MKITTSIIVALLAVATAFASDMTTRDGTVYQDVEVRRVEPDGITIKHSTGILKIHARDLSDEDRARFHLTPEAARAYLEQQRKAKEQAEQAAARAEYEKALYAKARTYELHCFKSDATGIYCWQYGTYGLIFDTEYFIPKRSVMPDTDFTIYAAPSKRIRISDFESAIELVPLKRPPKPAQ